MKNKWQDKLRTSLESYEGSVPEGLWEGIDAGMAGKFKESLRRKALVWSLVSMASAAALVLSVLPRDAHEIKRVDEGPVVAGDINQDKLPSDAEVPDLLASAQITANVESVSKKEVALSQRRASGTYKAYIKKDEGSPIVEDAGIQDKAESETDKNIQTENEAKLKNKVEEENKEDLLSETPIEKISERNFLEIEEPKRKNTAKRLYLGFSSTNIAGANRNKEGYDGLYGSETSLLAQKAISDVRSEKLSEVLIDNIGGKVNTNVKHRQPVRIGLSLNYDLNKTFGIETGLNYSLLVSDLKSGTDKSHYDTKQTLHYIGVPLNLNANIFRFGKGRFYVSGGGMVEKCVSATSRTEYVFTEGHQKGEVQKLSVKPLQWSVNAAAGLSYSFTDLLGIYVEPGASYYFDNKNYIETVYSEKPLNFSFKVGLRFHLGY